MTISTADARALADRLDQLQYSDLRTYRVGAAALRDQADRLDEFRRQNTILHERLDALAATLDLCDRYEQAIREALTDPRLARLRGAHATLRAALPAETEETTR